MLSGTVPLLNDVFEKARLEVGRTSAPLLRQK